MTQQKLTAFINDSSELSISLEWSGVAFEPGEEWALIFTAKNSDADLDSAAVFQKASGAGIAVTGSVATVSLVPSDTELLSDGRLLFDVQAQSTLTQKVRTVAYGEVYVMRDITRLTETSVPVTTSETPLPFARTAAEIHAAAAKVTISDADEFGGADSEASWGLKKWSWSTIKATLKTYFDTLYSAVSHSHAWGAIAGKPSTFAPSAHTHPNTEIAGLGTAATEDKKLLSPLFTTELANHQQSSLVNQQLTLWTIGDSMMSSSRLPIGLTQLLHQKVPVIGYAMEEVITSTLSGTVTHPPANANGSELTNLWDTGKVWQIATSGSIRAANNNGTTVGILSSKAIFYCLKQSGGGTATVDYSRNGTDWINMGTIDTSGTAGELARTEFTPAAGLGHYIYRVTATGGPVNYLGCKLWDNTRSGVILCNSNMGGLPVSDTLLAPAAIRNAIAADLGKVLLVYQFREGPSELTEAILDDWLDAWETALPNGEIILIDQLDTPSLEFNDTVTPLVNGLYAAAALERPTVRNYHINDVLGTEAQRDHAGYYNATVKGTVTVNTSTNVLTCSGSHSFGVGTEVTFSTTGVLPAPLVAWTRQTPQRYFVKTIPTGTTFTLSLTDGGAEIDITDSGSGTHSVTQVDTIHMSDQAWRYVGADLVHRLTNFAEGTVGAQIFRDGSGGREAMFGNGADEYSPHSWMFRVPRLSKQRWGLVSRGNLGGITRFGWNWQTPSATFADGVILELLNDGGYKTPMTIDQYGYSVFGPYNATTQSGYARGARVVVDEDAAAKSALIVRHRHATPTAPVIKVENSAGTSVAEINYLGRLKSDIPTYADDAAADADTALVSGQLYRTTAGARTVFQKP